MTTREQLTFEKVSALLRMISEDGASSPGALPPADYIAALEDVDGLEQADEVRRGHKQGRGPPSWAGRGNPGGGPK